MNITSLQELLVHVCDTCDPSNSKATNMSLVFELWWVIRLEGNNSPTGLYPSNYTQPVICYIFLRVTMATVRAFISPGVSIISGAISLMGSDTSFLFGGWVAVNLFSSWLLLRCQPLNGHHWYTSAPCSLMVIVQICLLPDLWRVNGIIYVYIYIYTHLCVTYLMVRTRFCFHFVLFSPLFLTHKFAQRLQLFIVMSVRWFSKEHRLVLSRTLQLHLIKSVLFVFSKPAPQPHVGDWKSHVWQQNQERWYMQVTSM